MVQLYRGGSLGTRPAVRRILVTGATGKVGMHFIRRVLSDVDLHDVTIRALCHNRLA